MESYINNLLAKSVRSLELGDIDGSERLVSSALKMQPKNVNALNILGAIKGLQGKTQECIQIFKELAKKLPRDSQIQFNLAKALSDDGQDYQALRHHELAINLIPDNPNTLINYGISLNKLNRHENALEAFQKAIRLNANSAEIWLNLSATLNHLKRFDESIEAANASLQLNPKMAKAWCNIGSALSSKKQFLEAIAAYDHANNINPNLSESWEGKARTLLNLNELHGALECSQMALHHNPTSAEPWIYIGDIKQSLGLYTEAINCYKKALSINPSLIEARIQSGLCFIKENEPEKALLEIETCLAKDKEAKYLLGYYLSLKLQLCEWENISNLTNEYLEKINRYKIISTPFVSLQLPTSLQQQKICAELFINERFSLGQESSFSFNELRLKSKIRIGYFSSDFKDHPVGILIKNIIPFHDRSKFEIYGFFLNTQTGDSIEKELIESFDCAIHLSQLNDQSAYELIIQHDLDIAIDLNGHTSGSRMSLFSKRIAPIQVNYLGYAGTTGARFYDYLIADQIAIPAEDEIHYTEKIAHLPNSFFPIDTSYPLSTLGVLPSRANEQLPENGFVFACFNNSYKISPDIFQIWMRILREIPNSILWLSKSSKSAMINLINEANLEGIESGRIKFADRVLSRSDHLSRLRLADLFLDTPNYNAHATAADALWVGVPVLTILGQTFAGRIAASQISALGIPQMITHSHEEYFALAIDLAKNHGLMSDVKNKIEELRPITPLFDTYGYVKNLECLYHNFYNSFIAPSSPHL